MPVSPQFGVVYQLYQSNQKTLSVVSKNKTNFEYQNSLIERAKSSKIFKSAEKIEAADYQEFGKEKADAVAIIYNKHNEAFLLTGVELQFFCDGWSKEKILSTPMYIKKLVLPKQVK